MEVIVCKLVFLIRIERVSEGKVLHEIEMDYLLWRLWLVIVVTPIVILVLW